MDDFRHLEFTRVMPRRNGIFAYASFPGWNFGYEFFVSRGGTVCGKAESGFWYELSQELGEFVVAQVKRILGEKIRILDI